MAFGDHIHTQTKRGCIIVTSDPATRVIEGKIQRGEVVQINAYYTSPFFRWPAVGETWVIREENGSWFLEGLWEEPSEDGIQAGPGDAIISTETNRMLFSTKGSLRDPFAPKSPVSVLPTSPIDGETIYFQSSEMAEKGVMWHLRYRAASTSTYKWECIGGSDFYTATVGSITTSANEAGAVELTSGPQITPSLNGEYELAMSLLMQPQVNGVATNIVGFLVKNKEVATRIGWVIFVSDANSQFVGAWLQKRDPIGLVGGKSYQIYCGNSGGISCGYSGGRFYYRPIRVG